MKLIENLKQQTMKTNKIKLMILGFLLGYTLLANGLLKAQSVKAISVSVTNESIAFPLTRFTPFHPGVEIGATFKSWEKPGLIQYFSGIAGFYHHERVENAFYLKAEYLFRPIVGAVSFDFIGSAGYMHTFYPGDMYVLDSEGEPVSVRQLGRPHGFLTLGFGLSYIKSPRVNPFIRQELIVKAPFAASIPAIIHSLLKLGLTINLNSNA